MEAHTWAGFLNNPVKIMDKVCNGHAPAIVTRKNGEAVVIMSLSDYEALSETACLLRSPKNARRLLNSVACLES
ncbi:MAG: type II toxin-antitoxin system prevent-host-death family antitoxin [Deltaproteobacteria bacterium]|nr:type II toxin-antitoxin system prevent-host-death family antitoxin [Deltaproteobacteria bacterium]